MLRFSTFLLVPLLLAASGCAGAATNRYFCEFLGSADEQTRARDRATGAKPNAYFNRLLQYAEKDHGPEADFLPGQPHNIARKGDVLYAAYLDYRGEREGFRREVFEIYRINFTTGILTHSYLYDLDPVDYETNFGYDRYGRYNNPDLFPMVGTPKRDDRTRIGWDKSAWQCREIGFLNYIWRTITLTIFAILSV